MMERELEAERNAMWSIALFVIAIHMVLIFWAWWGYEVTPPKQQTVKLVAKTIELNPQKNLRQPVKQIAEPVESFEDVILTADEEIAAVEEPIKPLPQLEKSTQPKALPQKEIEIPKKKLAKADPIPPKEIEIPKKKLVKADPIPPKPKKKEEKAKPKKVEIAKQRKENPQPQQPVATKKPAVDPKKKALLNQAQERIAKIQVDKNTMSSSKRKELKIPEYHPQAIFNAETGLSSGELSYRDELAGRLQILLKLPEMGKIQLKLTLGRTGKFIKVVITQSESILNKQYIEKSLPSLSLPGFGNEFGGEAEHTFSITLTSEL